MKEECKIESKIGRAEKIHIYVSGLIWMAIILSILVFSVYVVITMQLRE